MNNPNCGACGMLNSRGFCSLTACRFPVVNGLGTWQERILANKPKQTNADRIRGMSDEELCVFLAGIYTLDTDAYGDYDPCVVIDDHKFRDPNGLMDWLKSLGEEVDDATER